MLLFNYAEWNDLQGRSERNAEVIIRFNDVESFFFREIVSFVTLWLFGSSETYRARRNGVEDLTMARVMIL